MNVWTDVQKERWVREIYSENNWVMAHKLLNEYSTAFVWDQK